LLQTGPTIIADYLSTTGDQIPDASTVPEVIPIQPRHCGVQARVDRRRNGFSEAYEDSTPRLSVGRRPVMQIEAAATATGGINVIATTTTTAAAAAAANVADVIQVAL